jgi:hypothetical protein
VTKKAAFERFISSEFSIDYWSDVAIEQAIELANALSPTEVEALSREWLSLTPVAQARLAEVTSGLSIENPSIAEMLIDMLSSSNAEVMEASLDSLNSIVQQSPERLDGLEIGEVLESIVPTGKLCAVLLESLKQKCK